MNTSNRMSNLELLKLIAMFFIVLSHSIPVYGNQSLPSYVDINISTNDIQRFISIFFEYFGPLGNCIFICCSAWFLSDNDKVKGEKIFSIIFDCFIISAIFLLVYLVLGNSFDLKTIYLQFFSVTCGNNWYIGCYILLYIFHPYLNIVIRETSQRVHLIIVLLMFTIYCIISKIIPYSSVYNSNLVVFIMLYFFTSYMKKYLTGFQFNIKLNRFICYSCFVALIILMSFTNIIGLKFSRFNRYMCLWDSMRNPLLIIIALTLINIFNSKIYTVPFINYLSSTTLIIYVLHDNMLFKSITKSSIWFEIYNFCGYKYLSLLVLVFAVFQFVFAAVLACIYKETLQHIVKKFANKCWNNFDSIISKILDKLLLLK